MLKVTDEMPELDHGETEENPSPAPSASKSSDKAAVAIPPAATAPQDTPEARSSSAPMIASSVVWASMSILPELFLKKSRRRNKKRPRGRGAGTTRLNENGS